MATLATALRQLPKHQRETFTFNVSWWADYYRDPDSENREEPNPEEWAVEMAFRNMRGENVLYRTPWGVPLDKGHWCQGWYYCFRCYGD